MMDYQNARGRIFARGEAGFDDAVKHTSFSAYDSGRRPDFVHQANDVTDVVDAVQAARSKGLSLSVCSGGHSWAQNHIREGSIMLDLSRLTEMTIDFARRTAVVGPGLRGGDFDKALATHDLLFPVGHAHAVGLGGFLLQGGYGWYSRVIGMACESVTAIDVVLADGRLVHASETENSDLLWAARGAGPGFFGIVVRFHLKLHDRPRFTGTKIQVFRIQHLEEVLGWADEARAQISPKVEIQIILNRKAFGIFSHGLELVANVLADSRREAKALLHLIDKGPMRRKASFTLPLVRLSLNRIMRLGDAFVFLKNHRWFADNAWLTSPIAPALPAIRKIADSQPAAPSHALLQLWNPISTDRPDMAFSLEGGSYFALYGAFPTGKGTRHEEAWATDGARALEPFSQGIQLSDENLARRPAAFMAPSNLERLTALRRTYDPDGMFDSYGTAR